MRTAAIICLSTGFAAQLIGGFGVLFSALVAREYLRNPTGNEFRMEDGSRAWIISPRLNRDAEIALRLAALPPWALIVLGVGICANFAGGLLALV